MQAGDQAIRIEADKVAVLRGARLVFRDLSLTLGSGDAVVLAGPNGSGKSTLLAVIMGARPPLAGTVRRLVPAALLDQMASMLMPEDTVLGNFRRLNPQSDENACRAALARFRFRGDTPVQVVASLSGGQRLLAGLACVLGGPRPPQLLILDEPTNHLDLESIEAVESGLHDFDGALMVVSHDDSFLNAIGSRRRLDIAGGRATLT